MCSSFEKSESLVCANVLVKEVNLQKFILIFSLGKKNWFARMSGLYFGQVCIQSIMFTWRMSWLFCTWLINIVSVFVVSQQNLGFFTNCLKTVYKKSITNFCFLFFFKSFIFCLQCMLRKWKLQHFAHAN